MLELLRSLSHVSPLLMHDPYDFFDFKEAHVVAAVDGGSVKLPLSSKDGVAATAACGKELMFVEGSAVTWKGTSSMPAKTRNR